MTSVLESINYSQHQFNTSWLSKKPTNSHRTPLQRIFYRIDHYQHPIIVHPDGRIECVEHDAAGKPVKYPRPLQELCVYSFLFDSQNLCLLDNSNMPAHLFPVLLSEAILMQQLYTISYLVSMWPLESLHLQAVVPREDKLHMKSDYLTQHETYYHLSILDCIIIGLLNLSPRSALRRISFHGFDHDKRLCKELCRLPLLWFKPAERNPHHIHQLITGTINLSLEKLIRYLNRISTVYRNIDHECSHGVQFNPVEIEMSLRCNLDDVPIGLALQSHSPFRFKYSKIFYELLPDCKLSLEQLSLCLLRPDELSNIKRLDLTFHDLTEIDEKDLLSGLKNLRNLRALGIHVYPQTDDSPRRRLATSIGHVLPIYSQLQRFSFSNTNLSRCVPLLFERLVEAQLVYLNLTDCRLGERDMAFLAQWPGLRDLEELNLQNNQLQNCFAACQSILSQTSKLVCLSLSFCSFTSGQLAQLINACSSSTIKVLALQSYTPPHREGILELLLTACKLPLLEKVLLLPTALYAFPGHNNNDRLNSKNSILLQCLAILEGQGRNSVSVID